MSRRKAYEEMVTSVTMEAGRRINQQLEINLEKTPEGKYVDVALETDWKLFNIACDFQLAEAALLADSMDGVEIAVALRDGLQKDSFEQTYSLPTKRLN